MYRVLFVLLLFLSLVSLTNTSYSTSSLIKKNVKINDSLYVITTKKFNDSTVYFCVSSNLKYRVVLKDSTYHISKVVSTINNITLGKNA